MQYPRPEYDMSQHSHKKAHLSKQSGEDPKVPKVWTDKVLSANGIDSFWKERRQYLMHSAVPLQYSLHLLIRVTQILCSLLYIYALSFTRLKGKCTTLASLNKRWKVHFYLIGTPRRGALEGAGALSFFRKRCTTKGGTLLLL